MRPEAGPAAPTAHAQHGDAWIEDTRSRYRAGGLAGALRAVSRRPAVVVVDLQRGFTEPGFTSGADLTDVVEASRGLLDAARRQGRPIFFTTIAFDSHQAAASVWLQKMPAMEVLCRPGPQLELDPRLGDRGLAPVLVKTAPSAFCGTGLDRHLRDANADSILVCGATTSGCVRATVVDACSLNWPTFVVRDCVGDREQGPHHANLLDMEAKYADILDLEEADALLATAERA